ncbi:hypothetical protein CPB85DRAFT_281037 [Mucidula mucida]|nr:hypothetical protein CPB85DRAFT_281037 [Mucidula mucida]
MSTGISYKLRPGIPVDSLPVELLSYIFALTAPSPHTHGMTTDALFDVDLARTPTRLSSVCRHWRRIAWETPTLWTTLSATIGSLHEFFVPQTGKRRTLFDTSHFSAYLKLSRNRPIDILIDARDPQYDFGEPDLDPYCSYTPPFAEPHMYAAIRTLLPHMSRWRTLSIMTDTWRPMHMAIQLLNPLDAPLLEHLTLMRCNDYISHAPNFEPARYTRPLNFHANPNSQRQSSLRHLTLRGVPAAWPTLSAPLHLQTLDISSLAASVRPSLREMHAMLSACAPTLCRLRVLNDADVSYIPGSLPPISLPALTHLTIGFRSDVCSGLVQAGLVDAPCLQNLTVECETHPGDVGVPDASGILACFGDVDLESVTLKAVYASRTVLREVCEGVKHLEMERMPNVDCLLEPGLSLETLTLCECEGVDRVTMQKIRQAVGRSVLISLHVVGDGGEVFEGLEDVVVYRTAEYSDEEEVELPSEDEAYCLGGTFNDPVFDAMYMQPSVATR